MKEFRKTEDGLFICEECNRKFLTVRGLANHISCIHKINSKMYYDKWLKENIDGICNICGNTTNFRDFKYKKYCSKLCSSLSRETQEKHKKTCLILYNDENFSNKEKEKNTKQQRYNDANYTNRTKAKKTNIEKYGVEHIFQSEKIKEKSRQTCLLRYGVENPLQDKKIHEKQQKSAYKLKQFKDTNIYYRGSYELDFLEKYYDKFPDIQNGPTIKYNFKGKNKIYYPDFYISSLNLIIECKNKYLYKIDKDKIIAKKNATIANGFNYCLFIDKDYNNFLKV